MKKKFVPPKIASRINLKNDIFQKHKKQNRKLSTTKSRQHTHILLTTQKVVALYFKDVKSEELLSTQYQKLVKTTKL